MLSKLLKYDFKKIIKSITPMYIIEITMFLVSYLFDYLETKYSFLTLPNSFITIIFIFACIALPMYLAFIVIKDYYQSMTKDEGYLTHTLPVSKQKLVLSKFISSYVSMLITLVISIGLIVIRFHDAEGISQIVNTLKNSIIDMYGFKIIIIFVTLTLISLASLIATVFLSISLGQKHDNKLLMSVIYGLVLYYINQICNVIILFAPILFVKDYIDQMNQNVPSKEILYYIFIDSMVVGLVITAVYDRIIVKSLENKLNLE